MSKKPWYAFRKPDEIIPQPWLHPEAVTYFESILQPDFWVLEHGAGGSTLWLAERVKSVVTIEHDPGWQKKIHELAPDNVTMTSNIPQNGTVIYDLVFIDGKRDERPDMLQRAEDLLRPGGWLVLDNAGRPEYQPARYQLFAWAQLVRKCGQSPARQDYLGTEFWRCV